MHAGHGINVSACWGRGTAAGGRDQAAARPRRSCGRRLCSRPACTTASCPPRTIKTRVPPSASRSSGPRPSSRCASGFNNPPVVHGALGRGLQACAHSSLKTPPDLNRALGRGLQAGCLHSLTPVLLPQMTTTLALTLVTLVTLVLSVGTAAGDLQSEGKRGNGGREGGRWPEIYLCGSF